MCVPPPARRDRSETSTHRAARATLPPSPATAGGGPALGGTCVCRRRRVAIAARQARTVPLARRDRPSLPRPVEGPRWAAHVCAAAGASRSQRNKHAPCRSRDATARPSYGRWRARAGRHMRVPPLARRDRSETSQTVPLVRATRPPSPATAGGGRRAAHVCAAAGASRSQRDKHAPYRLRDASALSSRHWRPGRARGSRLRRGHHPGLRLRPTRAVHGVA